MKKIISLVLVLAVVFSLLAGMEISSNAYTSHTQSEAVNWAKSRVGVKTGDGQCVALTKAYYSYLGVSSVTGNGCDYAWNTLPTNWNRIKYYSGFVAQPGDIAVWTWNKWAGKYGHVAIVTSANASTMTYIDQGKTYGYVGHSGSIAYNAANWTFYGVIRPDFSIKPQNIGTNFYAFIIKQDTWHHITNVNGNVQLAKANNSFHGQQIWKFIRQSNGSYKIVNQYDGTCLDAAGASDWNGVNVQSYADNNTNAQRWNVYKSGNGYCLKPVYSNRCLDVLNNSDAAGTNVQLYDSNGSGAQVFSIYNVKNDGVTFSKPAKPAKVTPKVSVSGINVKVTWNKSALKNKYDSRTYTVNIYKDKVDNSHLVHQKTGISGTSYSFSHNKNGTFYIKVYAVNKYFKSWHTASSSVKFKITKACSSHSYKQTVSTTATTKRDGVLKKVCTKCGYTTTSTIYQISDVSINNYKFTYTGSSIKPTVKITDRNGKTLGSSDYSVNYPSGNTSVGKHDYQIKFKDKYSGTYNAVFTIYPRATKFTKGEKNKSQIRLTWNKGTSEIDGYRILRSTNSDFSNAKVSYPSKSTTQKTWSNLSSGTKYYFKIQTYKEVNGTKYLSSSHIVSVTTKS